jgi:hypothetical protein
MLIIGSDFDSRFHRLRCWMHSQARSSSAGWNTRTARPSSCVDPYHIRFVSGSNPAARRTGSNGCWPSWARTVSGRCRAHSGRGCAETEDRCARCFSHSRFAADGAVSASTEALADRAGRAAAAGSPAETVVDSDQGEEPVAIAGNESGHLHKTEVVGPRWRPCTGKPSPQTMDQPASGGVAANVWISSMVRSRSWIEPLKPRSAPTLFA